MQLDKIVETTFLPPIVSRPGSFSEDFEYKTDYDNTSNLFFSCFQSINSGTSYNINQSGKKAYIYSKDRTFFKSKKEAIKHCWKYFRYSVGGGSFVPKVEKEANDAA